MVDSCGAVRRGVSGDTVLLTGAFSNLLSLSLSLHTATIPPLCHPTQYPLLPVVTAHLRHIKPF